VGEGGAALLRAIRTARPARRRTLAGPGADPARGAGLGEPAPQEPVRGPRERDRRLPPVARGERAVRRAAPGDHGAGIRAPDTALACVRAVDRERSAGADVAAGASGVRGRAHLRAP